MNNDLQVCPGNSLQSFLMHVAYDLKRRQIEYLITAYFDENGSPKLMRQVTGRTSWVTSSITEIIEEAKTLKASGICLVHNHPARIEEKPSLTPSSEDINHQRQFLDACQKNNLSYLGDWIVSKGHFTEILYHTLQIALKGQDASFEQGIYNALPPFLRETIETLTKSSVVVFDLYDIGYIEGKLNRSLQIQTRNVYPLNDAEASTYQLLLTIHQVAEVSPLERFNAKVATGLDLGEHRNVAEFSDVLSFEEATRSCDALRDVYEASRSLSGNTVEYKEVKLLLTDNSRCGFFQEGMNQSGFVSIKGEHILIDVNNFQSLHQLFVKALKQLESLSMPESEKNTSPQLQPKSSQSIRVFIKGPDDTKKLYLAQRDFYKDAGVTFDKAKEFLTKGVIMSFEDKNKAMKFIEKYNQLGCKTELKEA